MNRETYIDTIDTMETLPPDTGKRPSRKKSLSRAADILDLEGREIIAVLENATTPISAVEIAHRVNERGRAKIRPQEIQALRCRLDYWRGKIVQKLGKGLWELWRGTRKEEPHTDRKEIAHLAAALFNGGLTPPEMLDVLRMRDPSGMAKVKSLGPVLREFEGVFFVRCGKKEALPHRQKWRAKR